MGRRHDRVAPNDEDAFGQMITEIDQFQRSLVAAVQAELERHAAAVVAEVDRLRDEGRRERAQLRAELGAQIQQLAGDQQQPQVDDQIAALKDRFDDRLTQVEQRHTRRLDELTAGLDVMMLDATRPIVNDLRSEHEALNARVDGLHGNLKKFDEQAARMVTYFNDVSRQMEQRQQELAERLGSGVGEQVAELKRLVDDNDTAVRKFHSEIGQSVTQKLNDAEDRLNSRVLASENRIKEESGQKIAEIDLHVSRVSSNLDDSLGVINDRIAEVADRTEEVAATVKEVDEAALEELKERVASAAGEAMLVRIELERFEKEATERTDELTIRVNEVESSVQDHTLDVSTAIQLERLDELERAMAELDPTQFVRVNGPDPTVSGSGAATSSGEFDLPGQESVEKSQLPADASNGPDITAIIAAAEGRSNQHGQD